jgi:hypothetical protein
MPHTPTLEASLEQLGKELLDNPLLKAVMMSKDDSGDVLITLVEGIEESHKVKFGRVDRYARVLTRQSGTRRDRLAERRSLPAVSAG